jgi:hypothetical protein
MKFFYKPFFFFLPIGLIASILTFPCLTYAQATDQRVINLLEKKCDAKEFIYCVELASRYLKGDFVRKDVTKSVELYQKHVTAVLQVHVQFWVCSTKMELMGSLKINPRQYSSIKRLAMVEMEIVVLI